MLRVNPFCALRTEFTRFFFPCSRLNAPRCTFHKERETLLPSPLRHMKINYYFLAASIRRSPFSRRSTNCDHARIFLRLMFVGDEKNDACGYTFLLCSFFFFSLSSPPLPLPFLCRMQLPGAL